MMASRIGTGDRIEQDLIRALEILFGPLEDEGENE